MKALYVVLAIAGIIAFVTASTIGVRYLSSVTTRVDVVIPEPGVHCALASTSDGTAISCYPEAWVQK